jgi:hypothetical protein
VITARPVICVVKELVGLACAVQWKVLNQHVDLACLG